MSEYQPKYWNNKGRYQEAYELLFKFLQIPSEDNAPTADGNKLRRLCNQYYQKFNNGVGRLSAEELITKREEVKGKIEAALSSTLIKADVTVDGVYITNFEFSKDYADAIEQKQVAQQRVLKSEQDLARVKVEADQKIAQAKAEAASLSLQREVITPNLIALRQIEAFQSAIAKWDGHLPETMVGGNTSALLNLKKAE